MIKSIFIKSLWGDKDISIRIRNNILIIVGENGTGKSTILRIIYEFLSCKWSDLSIENFDLIIVEFENQTVSISKQELKRLDSLFIDYSDSLIQELPLSIRRKLTERSTLTSDQLSYYELLEILKNYQGSKFYDIVKNKIESKLNQNLKNKQHLIQSNLNSILLYLPTYRRIEKYLVSENEEYSIVNKRKYSKNKISSNNSYEISSSNMSDIDAILLSTINDIYETSNLLSDKLNIEFLRGILSKDYLKSKSLEDIEFNNVNDILTKYSNTILNEDEIILFKSKIYSSSIFKKDDDRLIVSYLFEKFQERYNILSKKEEELSSVINLINNYLYNKHIKYDLQNNDYRIYFEDTTKEIQLSSLSSGEKQIVTMLTYIYLGWANKILILIDEPELSLSMEWQERFLPDIINGKNLAGLIAVTHSPYIFNNSLAKYVQSVEDFYE